MGIKNKKPSTRQRESVCVSRVKTYTGPARQNKKKKINDYHVKITDRPDRGRVEPEKNGALAEKEPLQRRRRVCRGTARRGGRPSRDVEPDDITELDESSPTGSHR